MSAALDLAPDLTQEAVTSLFCRVLVRLDLIEATVAQLAAHVGLDAPQAAVPAAVTSIKGACFMLSLSEARIRQLIHAGHLAAIKTHGRVLITEESIAKLSAARSARRQVRSAT